MFCVFIECSRAVLGQEGLSRQLVKFFVMQTFDRLPREGLVDENIVKNCHAVIWSLKG